MVIAFGFLMFGAAIAVSALLAEKLAGGSSTDDDRRQLGDHRLDGERRYRHRARRLDDREGVMVHGL